MARIARVAVAPSSSSPPPPRVRPPPSAPPTLASAARRARAAARRDSSDTIAVVRPPSSAPSVVGRRRARVCERDARVGASNHRNQTTCTYYRLMSFMYVSIYRIRERSIPIQNPVTCTPDSVARRRDTHDRMHASWSYTRTHYDPDVTFFYLYRSIDRARTLARLGRQSPARARPPPSRSTAHRPHVLVSQRRSHHRRCFLSPRDTRWRRPPPCAPIADRSPPSAPRPRSSAPRVVNPPRPSPRRRRRGARRN